MLRDMIINHMVASILSLILNLLILYLIFHMNCFTESKTPKINTYRSTPGKELYLSSLERKTECFAKT